MKRTPKEGIALGLWVLVTLTVLHGQTCDTSRYRMPIFAVQKTADIVYGNAPAMPVIYINENVTVQEDLLLDLYVPQNDTLSRRPAMLFAFGGGFLLGAKEDEDARALCDSFARKGFVTASINYRLNMNVADASSGERAVYRAVQDWSAAIRYLKEFADSFRIDTNFIFAGGVSAGSISAMHCQYMDESERPASSFQQGLPFPAPDLGCKDCSGNTYAHSSRVRALVNCWGAIGDTLWIGPQDSVPMISFHGTLDPVVPYGYGFPFTAGITLPQVYGSSLVHARQTHLGFYSQFVPFVGEGHNIWGTVVNNNFVPGPTQFWAPIVHDIGRYLWHFVKPQTGVVSGLGFTPLNSIETYTVPFQSHHRWCWEVNGGTIVSANPAANTVDIQWNVLGLRTLTCQAINHLDAVADPETLQVVVGPVGIQPANGHVNVECATTSESLSLTATGLPEGIAQLWVTDAMGKPMVHRELQHAGAIQETCSREDWGSGVYFLRLETPAFVWTNKIILIKR
jgi:hypothetical protein